MAEIAGISDMFCSAEREISFIADLLNTVELPNKNLCIKVFASLDVVKKTLEIFKDQILKMNEDIKGSTSHLEAAHSDNFIPNPSVRAITYDLVPPIERLKDVEQTKKLVQASTTQASSLQDRIKEIKKEPEEYEHQSSVKQEVSNVLVSTVKTVADVRKEVKQETSIALVSTVKSEAEVGDTVIGLKINLPLEETSQHIECEIETIELDSSDSHEVKNSGEIPCISSVYSYTEKAALEETSQHMECEIETIELDSSDSHEVKNSGEIPCISSVYSYTEKAALEETSQHMECEIETMELDSSDSHEVKNSGEIPCISSVYSYTEKAEGKPYKCNRCNKGYYSINMIMRHIYSHETDNKFKCNNCTKTFSTKLKLNKHEFQHGYGQFICRICKHLFSKEVHLTAHLLKHSCSICNVKFSDVSEYQGHMRTHKLVCSICSKSYIKPKAFAQHTQLHSELKV